MLSEQKLRDSMGGLDFIKSPVITAALDDACDELEYQGIPEKHKKYNTLQKYYTLYQLQQSGHFEDIASESVGDVSVSNVKGTGNKWLKMYLFELEKAQGMLHRIA